MQAHGCAPTVSPSRALCRRRGGKESVGWCLIIRKNNNPKRSRAVEIWEIGVFDDAEKEEEAEGREVRKEGWT